MKKSTIFGFAAGLAVLASAPVMAQEVEEPVPFPYAFELTPEPGKATDLMSITIAFPEEAVFFFDDNQGKIAAATLENVTTGTVYQCMFPQRNTRTTYKTEYTMVFVAEDSEDEFPAAEPITEPGAYELTIRTLCTYDENGEDTMLPWIYENYVISQPVAYTLDPEPGLVAEDLSVVTIDFYENRNAAFYENNRMPVATMVNLNTNEVYNCFEPERLTKAETEGAAYELVFLDEEDQPAEINQPGTYQLTIRAMYLEGEDGNNVDIDPIVVDYMIGYPYEYVLTPENGEAVDQIDYVTLEFPTTKTVGFMPDYHPYVGYLTNEYTGNVYTCAAADRDPKAETEGVLFYLYFCDENDVYGPIVEPGVYTLSIRGLVEIEENAEGGDEYGTPLPPIEAKYFVGDYTSITTNIAADSYTVYTLNGVKVINNGSAESLKALNAGMYIVNGQKVILRK